LVKLVRLKIGDVFEIETSNGIAFFQYVHKNDDLGSLIRILPGLYKVYKKDLLNELVEQKELFLIHFPLGGALKQKIVTKIGNYPIPHNFVLPQKFRESFVKFSCWHIIDYETWNREKVEKLTDEQKQLSPWGIWNDTLLKDRIAEGWTLDNWG
jgi:hypothetical protein